MRPIDADAAATAVHDKYAEYFNMFHGVRERAILHDFKNSVLVALDNIPAISSDEARGRGKWIVKKDAYGKVYTSCSKCGFDYTARADRVHLVLLDMRNFGFCSACGAEMEVSNNA